MSYNKKDTINEYRTMCQWKGTIESIAYNLLKLMERHDRISNVQEWQSQRYDINSYRKIIEPQTSASSPSCDGIKIR